MFRRNREFWYALAAIAVTTSAYLVVYLRAGLLPPAFQLFGHGIGVLGFVLMLMTETLYSFRKQSTSARWGSMSSWLRFHMFTGMVGSYMVLLHPAMRFRGLAAVVALLTLIVVISGLVGRYIYTAVPRALDGTALEASDLERQIAQAETGRAEPELGAPAQASATAARATAAGLESTPNGGESNQGSGAPLQPSSLEAMERRRQALQRQMNRLASTRRALAAWRAFHVPLTMLLFLTAFAHIVGAIYYATLLR
jgi:hypothetical protein